MPPVWGIGVRRSLRGPGRSTQSRRVHLVRHAGLQASVTRRAAAASRAGKNIEFAEIRTVQRVWNIGDPNMVLMPQTIVGG